MGPDRTPEQPRGLEPGPIESGPGQPVSPDITGRGGERFFRRLTESLKEAGKGFGVGFVAGFITTEIAVPLTISVAMTTLLTPEASSSMEIIARIANNMILVYTESKPNIAIVASIFGLFGGIYGAEVMGGYRFVTGRQASII